MDTNLPSAPSLFLPISGIGATPPYLVIAPPGTPAIRLDVRLLDKLELVADSMRLPLVVSGTAAIGAAASLMTLIPGGPLLTGALAYLSYVQGRKATRRHLQRNLRMQVGKRAVVLTVVDDAAATSQLCDALTPYTRLAPLRDALAYEDAKQRLFFMASQAQAQAQTREANRALTVGNSAVVVNDQGLHVGGASYAVQHIEALAVRGDTLLLPEEGQLQAAMALLIIAAAERAAAGEDATALAKRVADYEAWSGRTASR